MQWFRKKENDDDGDRANWLKKQELNGVTPVYVGTISAKAERLGGHERLVVDQRWPQLSWKTRIRREIYTEHC